MIKFLRKTRQKSLLENKIGKYFKYAIGEVFLVVIGILIALQINNWNENQKQNKEEISILKNLYDNLKQAKLQSTSFIQVEEKLKESLIKVLGIKSKKNREYNVSLTDSTFKDLMWSFESRVPVINTYSDIKSTGKLSVIKNRKIRESFNGLELAINELNNLVSDRLTVQQIRIDEIAVNEINFIPLIKKSQPDIDITNEIPNNYKSVLSNPKTRNLLGIKLELTDDVTRKRKELSTEIDVIIALLETELQKKRKYNSFYD